MLQPHILLELLGSVESIESVGPIFTLSYSLLGNGRTLVPSSLNESCFLPCCCSNGLLSLTVIPLSRADWQHRYDNIFFEGCQFHAFCGSERNFSTLRLPCTIIIGCVFYTISIKLIDHTIKGRLPKILKPVGLAEQLYECRAGCVIDTNKGTAIPCF